MMDGGGDEGDNSGDNDDGWWMINDSDGTYITSSSLMINVAIHPFDLCIIICIGMIDTQPHFWPVAVQHVEFGGTYCTPTSCRPLIKQCNYRHPYSHTITATLLSDANKDVVRPSKSDNCKGCWSTCHPPSEERTSIGLAYDPKHFPGELTYECFFHVNLQYMYLCI